MKNATLHSLFSMYVLSSFYLSTVLAASVQEVTGQQRGLSIPWKSASEFPVPYDGVGDPDHILDVTTRQRLADRLLSYEGTLGIMPPASSKADAGDTDKDLIPIQMAVAVVERLAMDNGHDESDIDELVEKFARTLHNHWGVVHETAQGGTGVLIFLDVYDRVVYISRGGALTRILSNARIDNIIHNMKHSLKQAKYAEGLALAVDSIAEFIERGEPSYWESFKDLFRIENLFLFFWLSIFCNGLFQSWKQRRDQVAYAQAASQLSDLDRAHAEALQGNYQSTSCPICLENFASTTEGSDGQPIKLLRCGHVFDESCWAEWVSSGRGDVTKCPVCRMDIGPRSDGGEQIMEPASTVTADGPTAAPTVDQNIDASDIQNNDDPQENGRLLRHRGNTLWDNLIPNNTGMTPTANEGNIVRGDPDRAMRLYQRDRNFRLLRLAQMYPRYISPNQVSQWTSSTYNGSLARDPSFANSNPVRNLHNDGRSTSSRYGHSRGGGFGGGGGGLSFGGGSSGGGRSGRF
jgi:uncharacterized membrane protein YgcG